MSATQNTRVIITIVNRIAEKLPVNSGRSLTSLEADPFFNQHVNALTDLAQWRLKDVVRALANALDGISRAPGATGNDEGALSMDVLQSQLFVLLLLGECTSLAWKAHREALSGFGRPEQNESMTGSRGAPPSRPNRSLTMPTSPAPMRSQNASSRMDATMAGDIAMGTDSLRNSSTYLAGKHGRPMAAAASYQQNLSLHNSAADYSVQSAGASGTSRSALPDPPPFDEQLARFLLAVITRFFYTSAASLNIDAVKHEYGSFFADHSDAGTAGSNTVLSAFTKPSGPPGASLFPPGNSTFTTSDVLTEVRKAAGRVLAYLSASNWSLVFGKIKALIGHMSQSGASGTSGGPNSNDSDRDSGDLTELRFLEWCTLNRTRLGMVLTELTRHCKLFGKRAQIASAIYLRRAIWNWIEVYPPEFQLLCQGQGRLEGYPEQLFETFSLVAENSRRKTLFWPVQTMLLVVCPEILYSIGIVGNSGDRQRLLASPGGVTTAVAKKAMFVETLRKNARGSKISEISIFCCAEVVRASTFVSKAEGGPLRLLGAGIEIELKERLFDGQRLLPLANGISSSEESGTLDYRLFADCITTLYKSNPWNTLRSIIPGVVDASSTLYKVALVKGFHNLLTEMDTFSWTPAVDASVAGHFRALFAEAVTSTRLTSEAKGRRGAGFRSHNIDRKMKRAAQEEANDRHQILTHILSMWSICPLLAVAKGSTTVHPDDLRPLFTSLATCLLDPNPIVRHLASQILPKLMSQEVACYWDGSLNDWRIPFLENNLSISETSMKAFWKGSSWILLGATRAVLDEGDLKKALDLMAELCRLQNEVLLTRGSLAHIGAAAPERFAAYVASEVSIIVSISGSWGDGSICKSVARWLEELLAAGNYGRPADGDFKVIAPLLENAPVYAELARILANVGSGGGGLKLVQKRVRAVLRTLVTPTPGNMGAWEELYRSWKSNDIVPPGRKRSGSVGNMEGDSSFSGDYYASSPAINVDEESGDRRAKLRRPASGAGSYSPSVEDRTEWANQMSFLCALGGICLKASAMASEQQQAEHASTFSRANSTTLSPELAINRRKSTGSAPSGAGGENYPVTGDATGGGQQAWAGAVGSQLLGAYSNAKAAVEKFVGEIVDLLASENVIIREIVRDCMGAEMSAGMYATLFGQFATIIEDQMFDPSGQPRLTLRNTVFADYMTSVLRLALDRSDAASVLSSVAVGDLDFGSIFGNLVRYVDALIAVDPTHFPVRMRLCTAIELLVAKRGLISLIGEMRIRKDITFALVERGLQDYRRETLEIRKLQRSAHLQCVKALARLLEDLPFGAESTRISNYLLQGFERTGKDEEDTHSLQLIEHTGAAFTALLSANTEFELNFAMDMTYAENETLRGMFINVLTNLIKSGGIIEKVTTALGNKRDITRGRSARLVQLIADTPQGLEIAVLLGEVAPVGDVDEIGAVLISIFDACGRALDLIERVVQREVDNTDSPAQLFRRNSMATRLLTIFANTNGQEYLRKTLSPILSELAERCPPMSFEVDPTKVNTQDLEGNMRNLKVVSQGILDSIIGPGAVQMPPSLREACALIWRIVGSRFPDAQPTAVSGFLFLRFICPAIVSPETHGIIQAAEVRKELRRGLVLITKVVQNLANNVLFGAKEAFMSGANDVLRDNVAKVHSFLSDIPAFSSREQAHTPNPMKSKIDDSDIVRLHRHLSANLDRLEKAKVTVSSAVPLARLSALSLQKTGKDEASSEANSPSSPVTRKPPSSSAATKTMSSNLSVSSFGLPFPFEDRLGSAPDYKVVFSELCTLLSQMGPGLKGSLAETGDEAGLRKSQSEMGGENVSVSFSPVAWLKGPRTQIPVVLTVGNDRLKVSANRRPEESGEYFEETFHASAIDELGLNRDQELFVLATEKNGLARGTPIVLNFASSKAETIVQALRVMVSKFRLGLSRSSSSVMMSSFSIAPDLHSETKREELQAGDVAGGLLNVAFSTFGSPDPAVRRAGYNLLCALISEFSLSVGIPNLRGDNLFGGKGVFIPLSNQSFLMEISQRIAKAHPELTLSFIGECALGMTRCGDSGKIASLQYVGPWIDNIAQQVEAVNETTEKLQQTLMMFVDVTFKTPALESLFRQAIWVKLAALPMLVPGIVSFLIQAALERSTRHSDVEVLANILHALACHSEYPVSSKIFSVLRKTIVSTSYRSLPALIDHPAWTEIAVLIRLALHLSFDDWKNIDEVLPDLFYVVSIVAGTGSPTVRTSVHGIIVNAIHTLATSGTLLPEGKEKMESLVDELAEPRLCLPFGLSGDAELPREVTLGGLDAIVRCLLDISTYGTADRDQTSLWRARWMSLISSTAFQYNPAVQPRAFIVLGCLARDEVDDDLLYQILVAMRGALTLFDDDDSHLIVSITMSLCDIVSGLPSGSRYLAAMFWLALALTQIGHPPIFHAATTFMTMVLRTLHKCGVFDRDGIYKPLLQARAGLEDAALQLDNHVGLHFRLDTFPFALAANLLKGVRHHATKKATLDSLKAILEMNTLFGGTRDPWSDRLAFFLPVFSLSDRPAEIWRLAGFEPVPGARPDDDSAPLRAEYCAQLLRLAVAGGPGSSAGLMDPAAPVHLLLSVLFMCNMLESAEHDTELITIYSFLAEASEQAPEIFAMISDIVLVRLNQTLTTTQSVPLIRQIQTLTKGIMGHRYTGPPNHASGLSTATYRSITSNPSSPHAVASSISSTDSALSGGTPPVLPSYLFSSATTSSLPSPASPEPLGGGHHTLSMPSRLVDAGLPGLPDAGTFAHASRSRKLKCAALVCDLVDAIIAL
ncbi:uncharacterized protein EV422DRAFT_541210 [Fimicolochytrium jonesii]|uniref:uncharacterized protein n=1 Tax=Fimicolochytrium jonesii TaxID=1396493 RepID=UPI0022FDDA2B|nr:uncharacterized protein EV422DRAFT_541210 [Fimicolochytrium jonesii]KAI8817571.1 hypothetical protein EV422DRAFT_541210 [Fimicolochytrium jonesii]